MCPGCDLKTRPIDNSQPLPDDEAKSLAAHLRFEMMYDEWDEMHPRSRLLPENEPDPRVQGICRRAEDLLDSKIPRKPVQTI